MKHQTYLDGVLKYYKVTAEYNSARKKIGEKKEYIGSLLYEEEFKRQEDYDFAEAKQKKLSMKVKTPKIQFDTKYIVFINDKYYECYKYDDDNFSNYLYLQEVSYD